MSCDHKKECSNGIYSKCRTEVWPKLGKVEVCDCCKAVIKHESIVGYLSISKMTGDDIIIGENTILDARKTSIAENVIL